MSILPPIAKMLEAENKRTPITGDVLTIGEQYLGVDEFHAFDNAKTQRSLDASDFEGATLIQDLNEPLDPKLYNIADFIFDGGCLDNIFNPANALKSFAKMLRPGGRLFTFNLATMIHGAYTAMSPDWHYDYLAHNKFEDIRLFVCPFTYGLADFTPVPWQPGRPQPRSHFIVVAMATKTEQSTSDVSPIQGVYRTLFVQGNPAHFVKNRKGWFGRKLVTANYLLRTRFRF